VPGENCRCILKGIGELLGDAGAGVAARFGEIGAVSHLSVWVQGVDAELNGDLAEGTAAFPYGQGWADGFEVEHGDWEGVALQGFGEARFDDHFVLGDGGAVARVKRGEWEVAWDLVDGFDACVAKLA
jgi:hypothetical protein